MEGQVRRGRMRRHLGEYAVKPLQESKQKHTKIHIQTTDSSKLTPTDVCRQTSGSRSPTGLQFSPDIISEEMKAEMIKIREIDCQAAFNIKTYSLGMFWNEMLLPILTDNSMLISVWLVVATSENKNKSATSLAVISHHVCCAEGPQKLQNPLRIQFLFCLELEGSRSKEEHLEGHL